MTAAPRRPPARAPRVMVVGDLILDVVLTPERPIELGTDVPGRVGIRPGGSAANTARWLARLGVRTQLVCSVGRDGAGRALVEHMRADGVVVRASRIAGQRTGRIGVLVSPTGERSFVADRRAADGLRPEDLKDDWFASLDLLHMPAYSLIGEPLGTAGRRAVELARERLALVSIDLASVGPLLSRGRRAARELIGSVRPDILFSTEREAEGFLGRYAFDGLTEYATIAVVKQGGRGATVLNRDGGSGTLRFEIATPHVLATDTTGAGDAFDAGFLAAWLSSRAAGRPTATSLHRATLAGHRAAARHLMGPRPELPPG
jgi:sugar/nucleoside kinase (ribokinase family)